jgi:hypothetical protein
VARYLHDRAVRIAHLRSLPDTGQLIPGLFAFHVAGLAGAIVAGLSPVPFHFDDAAVHHDNDTQIIAVFAGNALSDLPASPINWRLHCCTLARKPKQATADFKLGH